MKKTYKFEPQACYTENGITYRPFCLDGKEFFRMDIGVMLQTNAESNMEMIRLCEAIKRETGSIVSLLELPILISKRIIEVDSGEYDA